MTKRITTQSLRGEGDGVYFLGVVHFSSNFFDDIAIISLQEEMCDK